MGLRVERERDVYAGEEEDIAGIETGSVFEEINTVSVVL